VKQKLLLRSKTNGYCSAQHVQYGFAAPEFADKLLLSWLAHTLNTLQVQKDKYFEKKGRD
jgi:hypothetical protein